MTPHAAVTVRPAGSVRRRRSGSTGPSMRAPRVEGVRRQVSPILSTFNGYSLIANSGVTGALGLVYWLLMASLYPTAAVGMASAALCGHEPAGRAHRPELQRRADPLHPAGRAPDPDLHRPGLCGERGGVDRRLDPVPPDHRLVGGVLLRARHSGCPASALRRLRRCLGHLHPPGQRPGRPAQRRLGARGERRLRPRQARPAGGARHGLAATTSASTCRGCSRHWWPCR